MLHSMKSMLHSMKSMVHSMKYLSGSHAAYDYWRMWWHDLMWLQRLAQVAVELTD